MGTENIRAGCIWTKFTEWTSQCWQQRPPPGEVAPPPPSEASPEYFPGGIPTKKNSVPSYNRKTDTLRMHARLFLREAVVHLWGAGKGGRGFEKPFWVPPPPTTPLMQPPFATCDKPRFRKCARVCNTGVKASSLQRNQTKLLAVLIGIPLWNKNYLDLTSCEGWCADW